MTLRFTLLFASALVVCGTATAAPINLVINGSFEQGTLGIGSFQGWQVVQSDGSTYVDSGGQTGMQYGQATDGKWAAYFGSSAASGGASIAQTLSTAIGQFYTLTFDVANSNGGLAAGNSFAALINGSAIFSTSNLPSQNFVHQQVAFQATGATTTLTFAGYNNPGYDELDNVIVNATVTPEPSSLLLLITGLLPAGAATVLKRRSDMKRS